MSTPETHFFTSKTKKIFKTNNKIHSNKKPQFPTPLQLRHVQIRAASPVRRRVPVNKKHPPGCPLTQGPRTGSFSFHTRSYFHLPFSIPRLKKKRVVSLLHFFQKHAILLVLKLVQHFSTLSPPADGSRHPRRAFFISLLSPQTPLFPRFLPFCLRRCPRRCPQVIRGKEA